MLIDMKIWLKELLVIYVLWQQHMQENFVNIKDLSLYHTLCGGMQQTEKWSCFLGCKRHSVFADNACHQNWFTKSAAAASATWHSGHAPDSAEQAPTWLPRIPRTRFATPCFDMWKRQPTGACYSIADPPKLKATAIVVSSQSAACTHDPGQVNKIPANCAKAGQDLNGEA